MEGKRQFCHTLFLLLVMTRVGTATSTSYAVDHETQYLLTFLAPGVPPLSSSDQLLLHLVLTNPSNESTVEVKLEPGRQTLTLQPAQTNSLEIDETVFIPRGSVRQADNTGLLVTASHRDVRGLLVHGAVRTKGNDTPTNAAFTVSPVSSLGTEYVVVTHCKKHHCFLGIVAQQDTHVTVQLRLLPNDAKLFYNGDTFLDGGVIEEGLGRLQVMQILCEECDMSGSRITSTYPVAVLSGGEYTPIGEFSSDVMDTVVEYLPPVDTLGTKYVIVKDLDASYVVKVVAPHKDTKFNVPALKECYTSKREGDTWILPLPEESRSTVLNSTRPILVSVLISDSLEKSTDARMTVLTPASQWDMTYQVVLPFSTKVNQMFIAADVSIIVAGCIRYGDSLVNFTGNTPVTVEGSSVLRAVKFPLKNSVPHQELTCVPSCKNCKPFGGYVQGMRFEKKRGWAIPLGTFRKPTTQERSEATTDVFVSCDGFQSDITSTIPHNNTVTTDSPISSAIVDTTSSPARPTIFVPVTKSKTASFEITTRPEKAANASKKPMCLCQCPPLKPGVNIEGPGLSVLAETSRKRNRKRSAPDDRLSATVMGYIGVTVLVSVALVIISADVTSVLGVKNRKFRFTRKSLSHRV